MDNMDNVDNMDTTVFSHFMLRLSFILRTSVQNIPDGTVLSIEIISEAIKVMSSRNVFPTWPCGFRSTNVGFSN